MSHKITKKNFLMVFPKNALKLFLDFAPERKKKALWEYHVTNDA